MKKINLYPLVFIIVLLVMAWIDPHYHYSRWRSTAFLGQGFYTLLRITVCGASAYLAIFFKAQKKELLFWLNLLLSLIFNPFIPIHFEKATWRLIDLLTAIFFLILLDFDRKKILKKLFFKTKSR